MVKVFLADRQSVFRQGMRSYLSQVADIEICGEGDVDEGLITTIENLLPDIVLLDIDVPSLSGLEICSNIKRVIPSVSIIILTPYPEDDQIFQAIKAHASAYLNKTVPVEEIINTIEQCASGRHPINEILASRPKVAEHILEQFRLLSNEKEAANFISPLTPRETEILNYMAQGYLNKQISTALDVSEQTIKNHITSILRKLNVNARTQAVIVAIKKGLVSISKE